MPDNEMRVFEFVATFNDSDGFAVEVDIGANMNAVAIMGEYHDATDAYYAIALGAADTVPQYGDGSFAWYRIPATDAVVPDLANREPVNDYRDVPRTIRMRILDRAPTDGTGGP